jgi:peptidoglycan/LPS O-acetylase OafA/YrhL
MTLLAWALMHALFFRHQPLYVPYPEPSLLIFKLQYFLIGILIHEASRGDMAREHRKFVLPLCLILSLCEFYQYRSIVICEPLIAGLFFALAVGAGGTIAPLRLLASPLARVGADMPYSVYLVHGFFIAIAGHVLYRDAVPAGGAPGRALLLWIAVAVCSYGAASLIHHFVERPGIWLGRYVLQRVPAAIDDPVALAG